MFDIDDIALTVAAADHYDDVGDIDGALVGHKILSLPGLGATIAGADDAPQRPEYDVVDDGEMMATSAKIDSRKFGRFVLRICTQ